MGTQDPGEILKKIWKRVGHGGLFTFETIGGSQLSGKIATTLLQDNSKFTVVNIKSQPHEKIDFNQVSAHMAEMGCNKQVQLEHIIYHQDGRYQCLTRRDGCWVHCDDEDIFTINKANSWKAIQGCGTSATMLVYKTN